jgi:hypothetical protein
LYTVLCKYSQAVHEWPTIYQQNVITSGTNLAAYLAIQKYSRRAFTVPA